MGRKMTNLLNFILRIEKTMPIIPIEIKKVIRFDRIFDNGITSLGK
jgi:hypothetical protein